MSLQFVDESDVLNGNINSNVMNGSVSECFPNLLNHKRSSLEASLDGDSDSESDGGDMGCLQLDNEHSLQRIGNGLKPGKKTKGRVKIKMEFIENKLRRYTTFSKRKTGIMKKAYELSTLTGTQVMLLVASETGHVYTFATRKLQPMITSESGKALIQTCLNSPDPPGNNPMTLAQHVDQRMNPTGFEEPELSYQIGDEDSAKQTSSSSSSSNVKAKTQSALFTSHAPSPTSSSMIPQIINFCNSQSQALSANNNILSSLNNSSSKSNSNYPLQINTNIYNPVTSQDLISSTGFGSLQQSQLSQQSQSSKLSSSLLPASSISSDTTPIGQGVIYQTPQGLVYAAPSSLPFNSVPEGYVLNLQQPNIPSLADQQGQQFLTIPVPVSLNKGHGLQVPVVTHPYHKQEDTNA